MPSTASLLLSTHLLLNTAHTTQYRLGGGGGGGEGDEQEGRSGRRRRRRTTFICLVKVEVVLLGSDDQ